MSRHVPYLAEEAIERDSAALLAEFAHARGIVLELPIPVEVIVEKHLKLRIEFDDMHTRLNVPRPENGQTDILGAIYGDGSIFIDETLDPVENPAGEGRYRFTVAHELGHYMYHRHLLGGEAMIVSAEDETGAPRIHGDAEDRDLRRAEWQANRFASCLLVPLPQLALEWFNWMKSLRPFIFEEFANDPRWWSPSSALSARLFRDAGVRPNGEIHDYAFYKVASELAPIFGVSKQMMRIRLEALGLLQIGQEIAPPPLKFGALGIEDFEQAAIDRVGKYERIIWR
jgi:Zn-dependent peptidase ImmA (M78 family)